MAVLLVLRVRGTVNVRREVEDTLRRLNLRRKHNATLVPDTPEYRGMLQVAKDYVAWCPADRGLVLDLLRRRARTPGWRPLDEETLTRHGFSSFEELADALLEGRVRLGELDWMKPYFALQPPRGGYKRSVKRHAQEGGVLGQNENLPEIVSRMI
ncbi:MAG: 50S ribosomal protein L30 [Nitrososphaeria archaeon]|jgi:large subunit ribosomal protein L30